MSKSTLSNAQEDEQLVTGIFPHPGRPLTLALERDGDQQQWAELPPPFWIDVREEVEQWSRIASEITPIVNTTLLTCGFSAFGQGVLALSSETSAYAHHVLVANRLRHPPVTVVEGLEQCLKDLYNAYIQWVSAVSWLRRVAYALPATCPALEAIRDRAQQARHHQQGFWSLLLHVQADCAQVQSRIDRWNQRVKPVPPQTTGAWQEGEA